jgi:hypothetical protein
MDWKLLLTGGLPPAFAALAEFLSPVTRDSVRGGVAQTDLDQIGDELTDGQRNNIANLAAETAEGAVEASALIPTWIGVTMAIVAVLVEVPNVASCTGLAIGAAIWVFVSGLFFPRYFSVRDYRRLAMEDKHLRIFGTVSQAKWLSIKMIAANILAVAVVVYVSMNKVEKSEASNKATSEQHSQPAAASAAPGVR